MWHSVIITAVTSLASSNFFSTQSDACVHPIILIVHKTDQDFTHEIVIQNSGLLHKSQVMVSSNALDLIGILFQRTRLHWNSLPSHPDSLEIFFNALGFIGILFQVIRIHWNSLPSHPDSLEFSSNALGLNGILFQVIRIYWNSLPTHSASLEFSSNALGFI